MDFINFNEHIVKQRINVYGGSEKKRTVILDDNNQYLLKFPDPIREQNREVSYINNAISEYIGCHIFSLTGFEVQETVLGIFIDEHGKEKIACACRDIRKKGEELHEMGRICLEYIEDNQPITLDYIKQSLEKLNGINADEAFTEYCNRFVIDAFIGNTDRHNGNWGIIESDNGLRIAPVYDCGSSLSPLYSDNELNQQLIANETHNVRAAIKNNNNSNIHYRDFLMSGESEYVNRAVRTVVPKIDLNKICAMIDSVPYISDIRKHFYKTILTDRYNKILIPALENALGIAKSQEYKEWNSRVIKAVYDKYIKVINDIPSGEICDYITNDNNNTEFEVIRNNNIAFFCNGSECIGIAKLEYSNLNICKFVQSARHMNIAIDDDINQWKQGDFSSCYDENVDEDYEQDR